MYFLPLLLLATTVQGSAESSVADEGGAQAAQQMLAGLWIGGVAFVPEDIASVTRQTDAYTFEPVVALTFSEAGQKKFTEVQQGHIGEVLDFVVDGEVISSPLLVEPIAGPTVHIGGLTDAEAALVVERLGGSVTVR
jgi:preprotein translocase subunit SecD